MLLFSSVPVVAAAVGRVNVGDDDVGADGDGGGGHRDETPTQTQTSTHNNEPPTVYLISNMNSQKQEKKLNKFGQKSSHLQQQSFFLSFFLSHFLLLSLAMTSSVILFS